ncbi:MAG: hypothetical protein KAS39_08800, partial [Actinomycetia bacterium]|nr:hypothetical protein [Actinomycetes bacterium]
MANYKKLKNMISSVNCGNCSAPVKVRLQEEKIVCRSCGSEDPLPENIKKRVNRVRGNLRARTGKKQHIGYKIFSIASEFSFLSLMFSSGGWLFTAAIYFLSYLNIRKNYTLNWKDLSFTVLRSSEIYEFGTVTLWYLVFIFITGIILNLFLLSLMKIYLERFPLFAAPFPPEDPGGPPRCRCCGAELEGNETIRRCSFCGSDNVITGERYRKYHNDFMALLKEFQRSALLTVDSRVKAAKTAEYIVICAPPLIGLFAAWHVPFIKRTYPVLWIIPPVILLAWIL